MLNQEIFSTRLRELRKSKGQTLLQIADAIASTKATIANFENCNKRPSLEMAIALADYFNVSLDYLVGRSDDPTRR